MSLRRSSLPASGSLIEKIRSWSWGSRRFQPHLATCETFVEPLDHLMVAPGVRPCRCASSNNGELFWAERSEKNNTPTLLGQYAASFISAEYAVYGVNSSRCQIGDISLNRAFRNDNATISPRAPCSFRQVRQRPTDPVLDRSGCQHTQPIAGKVHKTLYQCKQIFLKPRETIQQFRKCFCSPCVCSNRSVCLRRRSIEGIRDYCSEHLARINQPDKHLATIFCDFFQPHAAGFYEKHRFRWFALMVKEKPSWHLFTRRSAQDQFQIVRGQSIKQLRVPNITPIWR